jgi:ornithine cyclodeaminase/alanine dehydrogenase-like protein (mu-crystallin family)
MLLFTEQDVRNLLPMADAVALMRRVFEDLATGKAQNQPRRRLILPTGSVLHSLAGAFGGYFGTKVYSSNPRHGAYFHLLLFSAEDASPLALMAANYLGQIRTGAATGFATDLLAKPDAEQLAIIGTGFQARSQLEAVLVARPFRSVRVWSRSPEKREQFAAECSEAFGIRIEPTPTAERAVRDADVIVTATNSREPVLEADWVSPRALVNAVGSNQAKRRELPTALIERAGLIAVDSIEQARVESGDLILALDEAGWQSPKLVELSELAAGRRSYDGDGPIVFKSNGLGVEDVAVAGYVYERADKSALKQLTDLYS